MSVYENYKRFAALFDGLQEAFGYNSSPPRWIKRPPRPDDWIDHLEGRSPGIGVAPLRPDNTVMFASIDLDEPDFETADEFRDYLPGVTFIERSKSGNAHVHAFFQEPLEAWVAMGVMKEATLAAGKPHVEVFPKNHDFGMVRFGNYINLPYHGDKRPILWHVGHMDEHELSLEKFLDLAEDSRIDPEKWRRKAQWLMIDPPSKRRESSTFGEQNNLHICAQHILDTCDDNPVVTGHRAVVYFNLAKALTNWNQVDHDEALNFMRFVNDSSPSSDRVDDQELQRILGNAERGQFTSTGCDDPLFLQYAHPDCPIAYPRS